MLKNVPIILALCLMLQFAYYAQNYASINCPSLLVGPTRAAPRTSLVPYIIVCTYKPTQVASKRNLECCRCNDNGLCLRCRCVKSNTCCVSCLPLKRGHCQNARPDFAQAIWPADASSMSVNLRSSGVPTAAHPNPPTPLPLALSPPRAATPFSAASNHVPNVSSFTPSLPFPAPAAEPNFV